MDATLWPCLQTPFKSAKSREKIPDEEHSKKRGLILTDNDILEDKSVVDLLQSEKVDLGNKEEVGEVGMDNTSDTDVARGVSKLT